MSIRLFDVQTGFGGANSGDPHILSVDECLESMERLGVAQALVRTEPDTLNVDFAMANDDLFDACAARDNLTPCPIVVPATAYDLPAEPEQVDQLIRRGARAAVIRPQRDDWVLVPWVYGRLLTAMAERRLPLYCLLAQASYEQVGRFAEEHPALPIILAQVAYRSQRTIIPLLETFPNVHLSLGNNWTIHRGVEQMVEKVGPERLLFGTGFPAAEPMMAVTQLMYAEIADGQKQMIGAGNLERLLEAVA